MTVQVLLSTYNGAAYLKPQIDSVLGQDHVPVKILVRDDGSSDGTVALLREYQAAHPEIEVVLGANLGFAQSFLALLALSSPKRTTSPSAIRMMFGAPARYRGQLTS